MKKYLRDVLIVSFGIVSAAIAPALIIAIPFMLVGDFAGAIWLGGMMLIAMLPVALLLGGPVYFCARKLEGTWHFVVCGFSLGYASPFLLEATLFLAVPKSRQYFQPTFSFDGPYIIFALLFGLMGICSALVFLRLVKHRYWQIL